MWDVGMTSVSRRYNVGAPYGGRELEREMW